MILTRLRERTQAAHTRLETHLNILQRSSSLAQYRNLLEAFYGFYLPLEAHLAHAIALQLPDFDFETRRKVPFLERDFCALGVSPDELATFARCGNLPTLRTSCEVFGCLYVVEGATLGGQIISRHIHTGLSLDATSGAAFFNGYGAETGRMWRSFGETLRQYAATCPGDALILQGAVDTFAAFEAWFTQGNILHE